jgi:DnaB-like helicase N terminal domain/AAA domain
MPTSLSDAVQKIERVLLGSILLENSVWPQAESLSADDFSLDSHRRIYRRMAAIFEDGRPVDFSTLTLELAERNELVACGDSAYLTSLLEHAFPANFGAYVRKVTDAARERRYDRLYERLMDATETEARLELIAQMQDLLSGRSNRQDWRALFHSYDDVINAPPARFAIDGFLQEEGITFIGALAGHGKTLTMLAMVRALLEGGKLFNHFPVISKAERVIYLIPEAGLGVFSSRLRLFQLQEHIQSGRLFVRTLSAQGQMSLTDSRLLEAAKGADIFLDTAIRFMTGDENNAAEQKIFAESLFALQQAGARTITGAHHSPKSFGKDNFMTLENVLRGSGDIGAMLATCWGLSQVDSNSTRIFVQNVKARDFCPCEPFIIQGRPSIDQTGYFELTDPPNYAGDLSDHRADRKVGRPETRDKSEKQAEARKLRGEGMSYREISEALDIKVPTLYRWLKEGA